jgi:DNA repair exonuclease SbcCD ATPase subunit
MVQYRKGQKTKQSMKKEKIIAIALGVALAMPGFVFAQNLDAVRKAVEGVPEKVQTLGQDLRQKEKEALESIREKEKETLKRLREEKKDILENLREKEKDARENLREEAKNILEDAKEARITMSAKQLAPEELKAFQEKREQVKTEFEAKREEFKKALETKREEAKQEMETKREEFKKKLEIVKDEKKKQIAEKLFGDINSLNEKAVANLKKAVDQIETVLNRILSRSEKAAANGADVAAVSSASGTAKTAIQEARAAIGIQAGKIYSAAVSSEDTLRSGLASARDQMKQDIEAVKSKVKAARDTVQTTATTLAQIPKVDEMEVATSTESATPTSSQ